MLDIREIKSLPYPDFPTTHTIKNDQLRKELESMPDIICNIRDKTIEEFLKYFRIAIDYTYERNDPFLTRHFYFKAVQEVNDDLINNNKPYKIDFSSELCEHFINETEAYWKKHNLYNDGGTLNHFRLGRHMETLDTIVRGYTDDDELILYPKRVKETDLVVLFL